MKIIAQASLFLCVMTILTGILYPALVTCFSSIIWPNERHGSLLQEGSSIVGSTFIAQKFHSDKYFWPRPSACDFNADPSSASNLGPTSTILKKLISDRRKLLAKAHDVSAHAVPESLLTSSGSGLDPHISLKAAQFQIPRVVKARGLDKLGQERLEALMTEKLEQPWLGPHGNAFLNVLLLNLALDKGFGKI